MAESEFTATALPWQAHTETHMTARANLSVSQQGGCNVIATCACVCFYASVCVLPSVGCSVLVLDSSFVFRGIGCVKRRVIPSSKPLPVSGCVGMLCAYVCLCACAHGRMKESASVCVCVAHMRFLCMTFKAIVRMSLNCFLSICCQRA